MGRDFAKKTTKKRSPQAKRVSSKPKEKRIIPVGVWVAVGAVIGFAFAWLLTAAGIMNPQPVKPIEERPLVKAEVKNSNKSANKEAEKTTSKPTPTIKEKTVDKREEPTITQEKTTPKTTTKFEFYNELANRTVSTPKQPEREKIPEVKYTYYLQVGSFKSAEDADSLRAKMILEGYSVRIDKTTTQDNIDWYRVQIGPITSRSKLSRMRVQLLEKGIEPMILKFKAG